MAARLQIAPPPRVAQQGAALVIGLILLLVLTLLAISGMNAATSEFVMAGNEQFRANAFQASEFGISQALANSVFDPETAEPAWAGNATGTNDPYSAVVVFRNKTPGALYYIYSANTVDTYHFAIQSTGQSSVRGASTVHEQGIAQIGPKSPILGCGPTPPPCSLN